jgi:hypothetical protein
LLERMLGGMGLGVQPLVSLLCALQIVEVLH